MKLTLDEAAIHALARSTEVRAALVVEAEAITVAAKGIARQEFYDTGAYVAGLQAKPVALPDGTLAGQVQGTDWKSSWAEFGWTDEAGNHHPAKAILRRAAESLGLRPIPLPK